MISRLSRTSRLMCLRSATVSALYRPLLSALVLCLGAPEPLPPCIRQRNRPPIAGAQHAVPFRVAAPHRAAALIGPMLRG